MASPQKSVDCLTPSPGRAILVILDSHTQFFQAVTNQIGERPQFLLSHFAADFHQQVDKPVRITGTGLLGQPQPKDSGQFAECILRRLELSIICAEVAGGVHCAHQVEECAESAGCIEVVVHGGGESGPRGLDLCG